MQSAKLRFGFLAIFVSLSQSVYAAEGSLGIEYGSVSFKGERGPTTSLSSYRLNAFDTTGGLTAGVRGALNQNAAQKAKEYQIEQSIENGSTPDGVYTAGGKAYGSYEYSWQQPSPTPTDGDRWTLTFATDGTPIIDVISMPSEDTKVVNSMLGIEYSSSLWSYVSAPLSMSVGWGMKFFIFDSNDSTGHGGIDSSSASLPIEATVSSMVYSNVNAFLNVSLSPISLVSGKPYYLHEELGVNWNFYDGWLLTASYRHAQDAVTKKDDNGDPISYTMDSMYGGLGYQF